MKSRRSRRGPAWGKIIVSALLIAGLAAAWRYTPLAEWITAERIIGWARAVRGYKWAPILVMLAYTPAAFLMFPRPLLTLLTVIAFGPWAGFAYGMAGILGSALATYYVGRLFGRDTVRRVAGEKLERVSKVLRKHGLAAMVAMRIVPAAPFAVEGIIAGAVRIKLWHYLLGTVIGMASGVMATSVFGNEISAALEDPSKINWWLVGAVVMAFIALTYFVRRWFARRET